MTRYHPALPMITSADASSFGVCAMLLQDQFSSERRAAAFASCSPTPKERRYGHTEREALAVTWTVRRFDEYVRGLQFMVETDHVSLTSLFENMNADMLPPMVQRLHLKLMRYQFQILHVPGKPLATVDTPSRAPVEQAPPTVRATKPFVDSVVHMIPDRSPVGAGQVTMQAGFRWRMRCTSQVPRTGLAREAKSSGQPVQILETPGQVHCVRRLARGASSRHPGVASGQGLSVQEGNRRVNRCRERARDSVWWHRVTG